MTYVKIKDFWICSKSYLLNSLHQIQGFLDFLKWNIFSVQWMTYVRIKDFWIFSKLYLFNSLHQIQGFLDFLLWIFFSPENDLCQNQGLLYCSKFYLFHSLHQIKWFLDSSLEIFFHSSELLMSEWRILGFLKILFI